MKWLKSLMFWKQSEKEDPGDSGSLGPMIISKFF